VQEELPSISVIIPTFNERGHIAACLDSVIQQDYAPERVEVLVVDGDSTDGTAALVDRYAEETGRVRRLRNPRRIVPHALNLGIAAARGALIVRIDAHTTIEPEYLREGVSALQRSGADNVGGAMSARGGGRIGEAVALATRSPFGIGAYFHFGTQERFVDTVYMGMWPRSVFARVGLFDEELVRNQDDEFNYRLRKQGGRILITPRMRSSYQNRQALRPLARQFYEYGLWKVRVCQKHPRQMSWRHFVPPAFVLVMLLLVPSWWLSPRWLSHKLGVLTALAAGLYAGVVGLASWRAHQGRRDGFGWLPIVFATIHFAWGLGFLAGLLRFASYWFRREPAPPRLMVDDAA
jgi:glycosyltransferase involved in cell wall biosynthesis